MNKLEAEKQLDDAQAQVDSCKAVLEGPDTFGDLDVGDFFTGVGNVVNLRLKTSDSTYFHFKDGFNYTIDGGPSDNPSGKKSRFRSNMEVVKVTTPRRVKRELA